MKTSFDNPAITQLYCSIEMENKYYEARKSFVEKTGNLGLTEVPYGIVHPLELSETKSLEVNQYGGVTDQNLNFIHQSLTKRNNPLDQSYVNYDWYVGANENRNFSDIDYIDEDVVFIGALSDHYGHFILEGLARMWFYLDDENLKMKCVYISESEKFFFTETFELLSIYSNKIMRIKSPTKFRKVIIPEPSIRLSDYFHRKYHETVSKIKDSVLPGRYEKVFFSKGEISNNRAIGEIELQNIFANNGYHIFHPEKLSMQEKISVLKGARIFVASSGTNVHNSVFLEDQSQCICLNRSAHYYAVQFMIDIMKRLNSLYIDTFIFANTKRNLDPIGPFLLGPTSYFFHFLDIYGFSYNKYKLYRALPFLIVKYARTRLWLVIYTMSWRIYSKCSVSKYLIVRLIINTLLNMYKISKRIIKTTQF